MTTPLFAPRRPAAQAEVPSADATRPANGARPPGRAGLRELAHGFAREAAAVVLMATALYAALALASFKADPMHPELQGADWVGPVGAFLAGGVASLVGLVAWYLPIELFVLALPMVSGQPAPKKLLDLGARIAGNVVVVVVLASLVHIAAPAAHAFGGLHAGGDVGELCGEVMRSLFSTVGSFIIGLTIVALILVGRASFSFIEGVRVVARFLSMIGQRGAVGLRTLKSAWLEARALEAREIEDKGPIIHKKEAEAGAIIAALSDDRGAQASDDDAPIEREMDAAPAFDLGALVDQTPAPVRVRKRKKRDDERGDEPDDESAPRAAPAAPIEDEAPKKKSDSSRSKRATSDDVPTPSPIPPVKAAETRAAAKIVESKPAYDKLADADKPAAPKRERPAPQGIRIVDTSEQQIVEKADVKVVPAADGFRLPKIDFLDAPDGGAVEIDEAELQATAAQLEKTLADYGVSGKVEEVHPGPTVTTFEVSPAAGTKVSKVASLADDLALGLSRKVRIIAPIPGKNRIGFEIPNPKRAGVSMRELVEDRRFLEMKAPLPCILGRDIVGAPFFADLASMPHVIVAGATGAGKSVGLNVVLVSLLYRKTPEELRLLMIDPKVVELEPYDGIPHMLLPVVTDMKQAANALRWAVDEMERRYQLFANAGTKNITTYNAFVERVLRGEAKPPRQPAKVTALGADGFDVEIDAAKDGSDAEPPVKLPFIVIVVDEFADLMMQQGKDVEASVARLAQKARAAGMHVILATQRPSVDVITGMIKANFPTRIAFRVSQKVDSRTILDEQGAEHLLGRGDMLVKMNGSNEMRRVQCPFISEEEAQRVTDFLRLQGKPVYDENILKPHGDDAEATPDDDAEQDSMYDQAVRIVADTRRCSTSWLQRKLGIGYNRAAKIVEAMERRGLVGPANGAKDREVLIDPI
jgi:S-DNA-T family DNA segregation ATPase FtsK/SpoIIIE